MLLPRIFGLCRGVKRALAMLEQAAANRQRAGRKLILLGQIIHNPWVNDHFRSCGVRILTGEELTCPEKFIGSADCAVIPAFGVPLPIERRLDQIGCEILDTSCGDVRRVWAWAERAVERGFGVLIFGRAKHDETVVTRSRLDAVGGRYVVVEDLAQARLFCEMIASSRPADGFAEAFKPSATNAESLDAFGRLAQASQTTMLYDETMKVRQLIREAFARRYGQQACEDRLLFEPTVCRATQDRQVAAVELCRGELDLAIVVGGFGSSNTRHLYELARHYVPAWFIEDADAIASAEILHTIDFPSNEPLAAGGWLPDGRPLRIGVLAGASSPEIVVGKVLQRLAEFLS